MTDKIAQEDIIEINDAGQSVVVVPKGQPIPEGVTVPKPQAKQVEKPAENKARKSSRSK